MQAPHRLLRGRSARLLAVLLLTLLLATVASAATGDWLTDYDTAAETARGDGKLILAYFSGSDWCRPCITLKHEVLETDVFLTWAKERFVLLQLDFPVKKPNLLPEAQTKHNEALAERYNNTGAFPLLVLIDPASGDKVGQISGYNHQDTPTFIAEVTALLPE